MQTGEEAENHEAKTSTVHSKEPKVRSMYNRYDEMQKVAASRSEANTIAVSTVNTASAKAETKKNLQNYDQL